MDNDERVGTPLPRREAVATLGTPALVWFAGCSAAGGTEGDGPSTPDPTTASDPAGTTAASSSAATTPTVDGTSRVDDRTGTATTPTADGNGSTSTTAGANACVARPALADGTFYVDEDLRRSDVRVDTSTGGRVEGVPLELGFDVYAIDDDSCSRLSDATVDIWQADAVGTYSGDPSEGTEGQDFLRGTQVTDERGQASFTTIYPGWYPSRTPHIHFKIRSPADPGTFYNFTSQLFFREDRTDEVYAREPYSQRPERDTKNDEDPLYRSSVSELVLDLESTSAGYAATFDVALHTY